MAALKNPFHQGICSGSLWILWDLQSGERANGEMTINELERSGGDKNEVFLHC